MNVEFLKDVALAVAQEQDLETVMKMIVGYKPAIGLAISGSCRMSLNAPSFLPKRAQSASTSYASNARNRAVPLIFLVPP